MNHRKRPSWNPLPLALLLAINLLQVWGRKRLMVSR